MADGDSVVDVAEYSNALRRWWLLILISCVLGVVLGTLLLRLQTGDYVSSARVEVRPVITQGDDPNLNVNSQVNTTTEQSIAGSQRVAERALALLQAADELGTDNLDAVEVDARADELLGDVLPVVDPDADPDAAPAPTPESSIDSAEAREVTEQIEVTIPVDSQILLITATAGRAERSQELAQAMAHAYLDFRRDAGLAGTEIARTQLLEREAVLVAELDELANAIEAANDDGVKQALAYQDVSKREELAGIGARLANISAISINAGEVLDDAELPESTSGLPGAAGPLSGLILGGFLGVSGAFVLDRRDDRFRSTGAELDQMGLRPMGTVDVDGGIFRAGSGGAIAEINSGNGESYRRVQGSLLFNLDESDKSVVLVSGTNNPHSTTTVAANLAAAASRAGRRTLLIGADLRRPSLHERFELRNDAGLSDVLSGEVSLNTVLQESEGLPNLRILAAGSPVQEPARLLQSPSLGRMISHVRGEYDLVVFEAPPVLQVADAVDLARLCEGAVLVIEPGRSSRTDVADSVEQLRRVGTDVVGTIVADTTPGR